MVQVEVLQYFFFILLLNEALKNPPGRIFFQLAFLTLEWL